MATHSSAAYQREWIAKNREKMRARAIAYYATHKEVIMPQNRISQRKARIGMRLDALIAYGGHCMCCGENQYEFLSLDHINGGGASDRKKYPGSGIYRRVKNLGYPPGFQTLCHNCNMAKGFYGRCPHSSVVE